MSEKNGYTPLDSTNQVVISNDVIAVVAGTAAQEVEGVRAVKKIGDIYEIMGRKHLPRGVKLTVTENGVDVDITILVKHGVKIYDVCLQVQKRVRTAIETMTGLTVGSVNVAVAGIALESMARERK